MKHKRILWLLPTLVASLSLTGCSKIMALFTKTIELDKTALKYTYQDYTHNNYLKIDSAPLSGSPKLLIVPIWFSDSSTYIGSESKTKVKKDIERAYLGSKQDLGWHSVKTYYETLSNSKLSLNGVVTDWYDTGLPSSYYYDENQGLLRTTALIDNVVTWYKGINGDSSLSSFDSDNNGYIDGVILIYGSPDYASLNKKDAANMWAYCYWLQQDPGTKDSPKPNAFFWASYDFMYGPSSNMGKYAAGDTRYCSVDTHTFIHEMGHILGLMDYYDYSNVYCPAGAFSMQDMNVGSHDPYSVMAFGWADPMVPTKTCSIKLRPFQEAHDLVLLSPDFSSKSPFDEYLLVEYYTPTGLNEFDTSVSYLNAYPTGPTKGGIRVWHVDARLVWAKEKLGNLEKSIANTMTSGRYYYHAMSNTYYSSAVEDYISPLGEQYADYNLLQLIRNDKNETYRPKYAIGTSDLFQSGSSFKMSMFPRQFVNQGRLNSGRDLEWSFKVVSMNDNEAVITFTKG